MLDRLITFSEFDLFAYLVVGLVLLAICDLIFRTRLILRTEWGFGIGLVVVVTAYVLGHLVSIPGYWFIEEGIAKRLFDKRPEAVLLSEANCQPNQQVEPPTWVQATFLAHRVPLSCEVLKKIRVKENTKDSEKLENNAWLILGKANLAVRADMYARDRQLIFLRLYTFSRNMAFVALFGALAILLSPLFRWLWARVANKKLGESIIQLWQRGALKIEKTKPARKEVALQLPDWLTNRVSLFGIFLIFGLGLLYRHTMFLRIHTAEILMAYVAPTTH